MSDTHEASKHLNSAEAAEISYKHETSAAAAHLYLQELQRHVIITCVSGHQMIPVTFVWFFVNS